MPTHIFQNPVACPRPHPGHRSRPPTSYVTLMYPHLPLFAVAPARRVAYDLRRVVAAMLRQSLLIRQLQQSRCCQRRPRYPWSLLSEPGSSVFRTCSSCAVLFEGYPAWHWHGGVPVKQRRWHTRTPAVARGLETMVALVKLGNRTRRFDIANVKRRAGCGGEAFVVPRRLLQVSAADALVRFYASSVYMRLT